MLRKSLPALTAASLLCTTALIAACSAPPPSDGSGAGSGNGNSPGVGGGGGAAAGGGGGGLNIGGMGAGINVGEGSGSAFPATPILDGTIEASEYAVFEADPASFSPGVCVFEPHLSDANGAGAMYPVNWLRPRFRWTGAGNETLWEIRLSAESEQADLRVYTRDTQWIMPQELWDTIGKGVQDTDITVTIRGTGPGGVTGMSGTFRITPALAGGSMVFWGTESSVVAAGTSRLYGFTMGDEAVVDTLDAGQVTGITNVMQANGRDIRGENAASYIQGFEPGEARCIGCHTSTPDGDAMAFTDDYPWNMAMASIAQGSTGAAPTYLGAGARELMKIPFLGTAAMLPTAWATEDRTMITTMGRRGGSYVYINYDDKPEPTVHDLIWIDLQSTVSIPTTVPAADGAPAVPWANSFYSGSARETAATERETAILAARDTAWGVLATDNTGSISNPAASRTGLQIAYSVSETSADGHPDWHNNTSDIKILNLTSPRAAAGGATPLSGASDPGALEYYPAFSPDDAFIAFNRAPAPSNTTRCKQNPESCTNSPATLGENPDGPYYNRKGEVFVVPTVGGTPHRLRGNDPVMCSGEVSPGVINSWPKWSSAVREHNGKNYYFVIFSSARKYPTQFNLAPTPYTPPIDTRSSQLYMSVVEHDPATGAVTSYAAVYLWNQNYLSTGNGAYTQLNTSNMTPAWEDFSIPEVPPVVVVK